LLKLTIEGAWHQVLDHGIKKQLEINILCVEPDSPIKPFKAANLIKKMKQLKLTLLHIEKDDYLFINHSTLDTV